MQDISITHIEFSYTNALQYELSISLRRDGFSFCIQNKEDKNLLSVFFQSIDEEIPEEEYIKQCKKFLTHEAFTYSYSKVRIVATSLKATIIPQELFDENSAKEILDFNYSLNNTERVFSYNLKKSDSVIVYAYFSEILDVCNQLFSSNYSLFPQTAPFLELAIQKNIQEVQTKVYISLESSFFDVVVLKGTKILLYNKFDFTNVNDYVYYVMNTYKQLALDPITVPTELSGKISVGSTYFDATQMFIKNVSVAQPFSNSEQFLNVPFKSVPYSLFEQTINSFQCE